MVSLIDLFLKLGGKDKMAQIGDNSSWGKANEGTRKDAGVFWVVLLLN